jgi:hypothetical protein
VIKIPTRPRRDREFQDRPQQTKNVPLIRFDGIWPVDERHLVEHVVDEIEACSPVLCSSYRPRYPWICVLHQARSGARIYVANWIQRPDAIVTATSLQMLLDEMRSVAGLPRSQRAPLSRVV